MKGGVTSRGDMRSCIVPHAVSLLLLTLRYSTRGRFSATLTPFTEWHIAFFKSPRKKSCACTVFADQNTNRASKYTVLLPLALRPAAS